MCATPSLFIDIIVHYTNCMIHLLSPLASKSSLPPLFSLSSFTPCPTLSAIAQVASNSLVNCDVCKTLVYVVSTQTLYKLINQNGFIGPMNIVSNKSQAGLP